LFCFIGLAIMRDAPTVNGWHEAALVTLTFSGMLLTAKIFSGPTLHEHRRIGETIADEPFLELNQIFKIDSSCSNPLFLRPSTHCFLNVLL
jgi:hypothetical protein